jgi:hypothetical protein
MPIDPDNVVDLSSLKKSAAVGDDVALTAEEQRDAQLLLMVRELTSRVATMEAEQKAMDQNMEHIAQALQAVVEAAAAKLKLV